MTKDELITQEIKRWLGMNPRKPKTFVILANEIALKVQRECQDASLLFYPDIATLEFKCYVSDRIEEMKNNKIGMF